jgi:hypothetical protein
VPTEHASVSRYNVMSRDLSIGRHGLRVTFHPTPWTSLSEFPWNAQQVTLIASARRQRYRSGRAAAELSRFVARHC